MSKRVSGRFKLFPDGASGMRSHVFVPNVKMCVKQKNESHKTYFLHYLFLKSQTWAIGCKKKFTRAILFSTITPSLQCAGNYTINRINTKLGQEMIKITKSLKKSSLFCSRAAEHVSCLFVSRYRCQSCWLEAQTCCTCVCTPKL